jgi:DNA invertase Pin-like site-specific DNA recombinase
MQPSHKTSWPDPSDRPIVAYYRVSTVQQGRSGLGLEAQRESVRRYLNANPGRLIVELTEVESGGKNNRPKVAEALWLCRVYEAKLVIARLDRLSRNVALVAGLLESGVDFVAADMPLANRFTIHLIAAVAEYEAKLISERTKAAFAVAKARGKKRGGPRRADFRDYFKGGSAASAIARSERANARARDMAPLLRELRDAGHSLCAIARKLTAMEIPTPSSRGKQWYPAVVRRHFVYAGEKLPKRRGDKAPRVAHAGKQAQLPMAGCRSKHDCGSDTGSVESRRGSEPSLNSDATAASATALQDW